MHAFSVLTANICTSGGRKRHRGHGGNRNPGPVGKFKVSGTLGGKQVAVLMPGGLTARCAISCGGPVEVFVWNHGGACRAGGQANAAASVEFGIHMLTMVDADIVRKTLPAALTRGLTRLANVVVKQYFRETAPASSASLDYVVYTGNDCSKCHGRLTIPAADGRDEE